MSRVYGALLQLEHFDPPGVPASIDDVARIAFEWAGVEGVTTAAEGRFDARNDGDVISERYELDETGALAWRFAFQHADKDDSEIRWRVTVTAVEGESTRAAVELHRFRVDGIAREPLMSVDPPRLVREYLESKLVRAVDADVDCRARHKTVAQDSAAKFVAFACSSERRLPIVLFTEGGGRAEIDYKGLQRRLAGVAHVVVLEASASWDVSKSLQPGITPWGGWTRIWWPGFSRNTTKSQAPWWAPTTPMATIISEVEGRVIAAATQSFAGLPEFNEVRDRARQREVAERAEVITETKSALTQLEERATRETDSAELDKISQDRIKYLEQLVGKESDRADEAERLHYADLESFEQEVQFLKEDRDSAHAELKEHLAADDEEQKRHRVEDATRAFREEIDRYYASWPPDDQTQFPLGKAQFHAKFIDSVRSVANNKQEQVVEKCTLLIADRTDAVDTKENKPSEGHEERRDDGAVAMRAYLEQRTPQARRILYWRLRDGAGLEFVRVARHDDMAIAETSTLLL